MKMTLTEILQKQRILSTLANMKLPYKLAYAISKNLGKMEAEVKAIEETRLNIIKEYAVKDENGEPVINDNVYDLGDNMEAFAEEFQNFLATETEVDIFTVPEAVLGADDPRFDVLTVAQIVAIDFMIVEGGEKHE